jgi:archaellum biogenesis protein FlaJ (TadC family)
MTPLSNISLNKIFKKIAHMFMKQSYGQTFQQFKRCYALTSIRHYEFNGGVSNIVAHGKGEEVDVPRLMFNGIFG